MIEPQNADTASSNTYECIDITAVAASAHNLTWAAAGSRILLGPALVSTAVFATLVTVTSGVDWISYSCFLVALACFVALPPATSTISRSTPKRALITFGTVLFALCAGLVAAVFYLPTGLIAPLALVVTGAAVPPLIGGLAAYTLQRHATDIALFEGARTSQESASSLARRFLWFVARIPLFGLLFLAIVFLSTFAQYIFFALICARAGCNADAIARVVEEDEFLSTVWTIFNVILTLWCWRLGRRFFSRRADRALRDNTKPPVVYLRQFRADRADYLRFWSAGRLYLLFLFDAAAFFGFPLPRRLHFKRLEEIASEEVDPTTPFIAIGDPRERLPELGAARAYRSDQDWQDTVTDWLGKAGTIILVAAPTKGLQWELHQIIERGLLPRTVLLFSKPPTRATELSASIPIPGVLDALSRDLVRRLRAAVFLPGRTILIESKSGRECDYALAMRTALVLLKSAVPSKTILTPIPEGSAPSPSEALRAQNMSAAPHA